MTKHQIDRLPLLTRDPGYIGASLARLADQLSDGWAQSSALSLPKTYRRVTAIAVCGMGGSHLGPDIIRSIFTEHLKVPMTIVADYHLPAWATKSTLVICSSYSGSTEETIACLAEARRRGCSTVVVASGGALAKEARRRRVPLVQFQPLFNPSRQPRLGLGYSLTATIRILHDAGLLRFSGEQLQSMVTAAVRAGHAYGPQRPAKTNPAKMAALQLYRRLPILIGAEWTAGNLHTWTNQIHENAKSYAAWYQLPDLNHHLLEGMRNRALTKQMVAVFVRDSGYADRNLRRLTLTKAILNDLGATTLIVTPRGQTTLEKAIDLLAFGGYVSWYMAAVCRVLPGPIPTVDRLKAALGKAR